METVKIKLLSGGCGYESVKPDGSILRSLKTPKDGPFDCPLAMAAKMIESGQAIQLDEYPKTAHEEKPKASKYEFMTLKKLQALADEQGLIYDAKAKKADLIAALEDIDD